MQACGVGHADGVLAIDHQHPVGQGLHDQGTDLALQSRRHAAVLYQLLFTHQARGELVHQKSHDEVARARQCGLQVALCGVATAMVAQPPGPGQQQKGGSGRGAQSQRQRAQHRRHQNGQAQQRCEIHAAGVQPLQCAHHEQINADGGQPLRPRLGRWHAPAPHASGQRGGQVNQARRPLCRLHVLVERLGQALQQHQGQGYQDAPG